MSRVDSTVVREEARMTRIYRIAAAAVLVGALAAPAAAQSITQSDVQRLNDNVYLAERDVNQLRNRYAARATALQAELDDLRDEVVYLKVKLRKERSLPRSEYADVQDRIESVRSRAQGTSSSAYSFPGRDAAPGTTSSAQIVQFG